MKYQRMRFWGKCSSVVMIGMAIVTTPARNVVIPVLYVMRLMIRVVWRLDTEVESVSMTVIAGDVERPLLYS